MPPTSQYVVSFYLFSLRNNSFSFMLPVMAMCSSEGEVME